MVTMIDVLDHIAEGGEAGAVDLDQRMSVPVSSVIGHSLEGLSLWTINPNTSIVDCLEMFSKGIHRALVPVESHMENISGVELTESSSRYQMLTQMDVLRFLKCHELQLKNFTSRSVGELGAVVEDVFGVTGDTKVIDAIKCMRTASLNAAPIVESSSGTTPIGEAIKQLVDPNNVVLNGPHESRIDEQGRGMKLIGTFSATDLRGCPNALLQNSLHMDVIEFTEQASKGSHSTSGGDMGRTSRVLVTCHAETSLGEVMEKAVTAHVHRVWVVDHQGLLVGIVSLTDMLRVLRALLLSS
ncbi:hypothetical protein Sjap_019289 [Stephania japonica]|uniref:CBS domain-containing protein n=1 Tax=Stephania japonica TaxID=461633 RepID=A0AAP0F197_9MAGN